MTEMQSFHAIKYFIANEFGIDVNRIKYETDLQSDLNIYGDDATELIILLRDRFKVDISSFELDLYFRGEGFSFLEFIGIRPKPVYKKLLIKDLVRSVEVGYLV